MKSKAYKKFKRLDKVLDEYGGGAVQWKDMIHMEQIKPNMRVLFHAKRYMENGKNIKVMIMLVEMGK